MTSYLGFSNLDFKVDSDRTQEVLNDNRYNNVSQKELATKPLLHNFVTNNNKLNTYDPLLKDHVVNLKSNSTGESATDFKEQKIMNFYEELKQYEDAAPVNMTIEGRGLNRWYNLYLNPQENCIEQFPRIGMNSVLDVLDNHKPCPVSQEMLDGFSQ